MSNLPKKKIRIKKIKPASEKKNSGVKQPRILPHLLKKLFLNKKFFYIAGFLFLIFIPWVPVLFFGVLVYFPYTETGKSRYMRITGPLVQFVGADWVSTDKIPSACKKSVVVAEDSDFYNHNGISIGSIIASFEYNRKRGRIISGASTISQQFIKNAFLSRDKTYLRKLREALGAIFFNLLFSKDQQLTWYLNIVEFGPNVYGLKSASAYYFRKSASNLSVHECAVLATLLPRPVYFGRGLKAGRFSNPYQRRLKRISSGIGIKEVTKQKEELTD